MKLSKTENRFSTTENRFAKESVSNVPTEKHTFMGAVPVHGIVRLVKSDLVKERESNVELYQFNGHTINQAYY